MIGLTRIFWSLLCITLVSSKLICSKLQKGDCIHDCGTSSEQDITVSVSKPGIKSFQVSNCRTLSLPKYIFKFPVKVALTNIDTVTIRSWSHISPNQPAKKREFVMKNCNISKFTDNMFDGLKFSKIEIRSSSIERLEHQVFKDIEVDDLVIIKTRIDTISDEAFDLQVKNQLTFKNNTVSHMHADSFTAMKVDPTISISLEKNTMNELLSSKFHLNFDPSMNKVNLSKVRFHNNIINEACGCDLFGVSESSHNRADLAKFIYGKLMLSFQCVLNNQTYAWIDFDELSCKDEHGHHHGREDHDEEFKKFFDSKLSFALSEGIDVKVDLFFDKFPFPSKIRESR